MQRYTVLARKQSSCNWSSPPPSLPSCFFFPATPPCPSSFFPTHFSVWGFGYVVVNVPLGYGCLNRLGCGQLFMCLVTHYIWVTTPACLPFAAHVQSDYTDHGATCDAKRWAAPEGAATYFLVFTLFISFPCKCYIPEIHPIKKLGFLGISRYKFKLRFWFSLILYHGIWVIQFGGFRGCSICIFSGICYKLEETKRKKIQTIEYAAREGASNDVQGLVPELNFMGCLSPRVQSYVKGLLCRVNNHMGWFWLVGSIQL